MYGLSMARDAALDYIDEVKRLYRERTGANDLFPAEEPRLLTSGESQPPQDAYSYELARLNAANGTDLTRTVSAYDVKPQVIVLPEAQSTIGIESVNLPDEIIGRSVGAKSKNYDILDLSTGSVYHLVEGTRLQNVEVFAGKGTRTEFRDAIKYSQRYGGELSDWQHAKGVGIVNTPGGGTKAELHWIQCEGVGKKEMFVKEWLE